MKRKEIIKEIKRYFDIRELVCKDVYNRFKGGSWRFLDANLLEVLLWVRTTLNKPITINTWHTGGKFSQRGLRCNRCELVKTKNYPYLSAHLFGRAIDFDVKGMSSEQVRQWLNEHKEELPHPIRLESGVNWVHLDIMTESDDKMIEFFNG